MKRASDEVAGHEDTGDEVTRHERRSRETRATKSRDTSDEVRLTQSLPKWTLRKPRTGLDELESSYRLRWALV